MRPKLGTQNKSSLSLVNLPRLVLEHRACLSWKLRFWMHRLQSFRASKRLSKAAMMSNRNLFSTVTRAVVVISQHETSSETRVASLQSLTETITSEADAKLVRIHWPKIKPWLWQSDTFYEVLDLLCVLVKFHTPNVDFEPSDMALLFEKCAQDHSARCASALYLLMDSPSISKASRSFAERHGIDLLCAMYHQAPESGHRETIVNLLYRHTQVFRTSIQANLLDVALRHFPENPHGQAASLLRWMTQESSCSLTDEQLTAVLSIIIDHIHQTLDNRGEPQIAVLGNMRWWWDARINWNPCTTLIDLMLTCLDLERQRSAAVRVLTSCLRRITPTGVALINAREGVSKLVTWLATDCPQEERVTVLSALTLLVDWEACEWSPSAANTCITCCVSSFAGEHVGDLLRGLARMDPRFAAKIVRRGFWNMY